MMALAKTHLWWAWLGVLLGMGSGALMGLFCHEQQWLGGYASWQRRMLRLGHISFFGMALLNFAYAGTALIRGGGAFAAWISPLLIAGAVLMPVVCLASALHQPLRHLFVLPVTALVGAAGLLVWEGF